MTRHLTTARHALDELTTAVARIPATLRNLDACAPGFPATTPGNGSPGGSVGGNGSRTETAICATEVGSAGKHTLGKARGVGADTALADRAAIDKLVRRIAADTAVLSAITDRWGWQQAGECNHSAAPRYAGQVPDNGEVRWCVSCARLHKTTHTFAADQCRWCYEFKRAEGVLPPLELLDAHHQGKRITEAMVRQALRPKGKTKR